MNRAPCLNNLSGADAGRLKAGLIADRAAVRTECGQVSRAIHKLAEVAGAEYGSRDCMIEAVSRLGCRVTQGLGPYETGMSATTGSGGLHVALMAEYDALPVIGHACGHNLVSGASLAAFMLLMRVADQIDLKVTLFGTPSEEIGAAKIELAESGAFDEVDFAMMVHPAPSGVDAPRMAALARYQVGIESAASGHSSAYSSGVTVSEAWHVLATGLGLLPRLLPPGATVDWEVLSTSGSAAVQARHLIADVILRVWEDAHFQAAAEALAATCGAVATITRTKIECSLTQRFMPAMRQNAGLARLWRGNRAALGMTSRAVPFPAATDLGALSLRIPCLHPYFSIGCWPAKNHDPEFTQAAVSERAHSAMVNAGTAMAMTVVDVAAVGYPTLHEENYTESISTQRS